MTNSTENLAASMNFEIVPDLEDEWLKEIAEKTIKLQEKRKSNQKDEVLRGVHPKSHGCLEADFIINKNLCSDLQVGLFAKPGRCFKAKIRYSNADVLKRADTGGKTDNDGNKLQENGSRGMAIKVLDVDGPVFLEDGSAKNQDFLMVNTPEFAFRNVRDYLRLTLALLASEDAATPDLFFLPAKLLALGLLDLSGNLLPPLPTETPTETFLRNLFVINTKVFEDYSADDVQGVRTSGSVVQKIQSIFVRNPIDARYFSAAPFRFGPDRVMKFSVEPLGGEPPIVGSIDDELDEDYLSQALASAIASGDTITLSFKVQIVQASDIVGHEDEMIENASIAWDESKYKSVEVARLVIRPQDQDEQLVDACKPLLFTPWHALAAHEPLGGINRLRKPVYSGSADFRRNT